MKIAIKNFNPSEFVKSCKYIVQNQCNSFKELQRLSKIHHDEFVNDFSIVAPKDENEFSELVDFFLKGMKPILYNSSSKFTKKIYPLYWQLLKSSIKIKMESSNANLIKNSSGKILGGFSYNLERGLNKELNNFYISGLVFDESIQHTRNGLEVLKVVGKRIKELATQSGDTKITCDVAAYRKGIINLYKRMGFQEIKRSKKSLHMSVPVEDFGKGYFD